MVRLPVIPDPSFAVAIAVMSPLSTADTRPVLFIVASPVPLTTDQVTVLSVVFDGNTAAFS